MAEKKLLDDLKKNLLSSEELEQVAGGKAAENVDIVNVMSQVDPQGTANMLHELQDCDSPKEYESHLKDKLTILINNNFQKKGLNVNYSGSVGVDNRYFIDGKKVSHKQFCDFLSLYKKGGGNDF